MFGLIVRKELREILGTPRFAATFGVVSLLIVLAFYLGAREYQASRARYETAVSENLRQLEGYTDWLDVRPAIFLPPRPLAALVTGVSNDIGRNVTVQGMGTVRASESRYNEDPVLAVFRFLDLEFVFQVVLSLFAVLFGFDLVSGEKERGTLRLALSSAVPRGTFIAGKLTGATIGLTVPLLIPLTGGALLVLVLGLPMSGGDWLRLALVAMAGLLYVAAFLGLSVLVSSLTQRSATSFLVLLVAWILTVMILPRSAVLLAARMVAVPSIDENLSQLGRLRAQLWSEDRDAIDRYLRDNMPAADELATPQDQARMVGRFNNFFQELGESRNRRVEDLDERLREERGNRLALQERLALGLARLSPTAAFSIAALELAGTALDLPRLYLEQARAYQEVFERFQKEKSGGQSSGGIRMIVRFGDGEDEDEVAIDPGELPGFEFREPPLGEIVRGGILDLGLLVFFNLLFFAGAFVAFLRYDVR